MSQRWTVGGCSRGILLTAVLMLSAKGVAAQGADTARAVARSDAEAARVTEAVKGAEASKAARPWRTRWTVGLKSSYDHNPFRLSPGQRADLVDGFPAYESLSQPYDMTNAVRLGLSLRGRGMAGRRLELESQVEADLYTFNRRRSSVSLDLSATQSLSKREDLRFGVEFTPAEFRRNYVAGSDAGGGAVYGAGVATTIDAELSYDRRVLRGKGAQPRMDLTLALLGTDRTFRDMPWRDRQEVGAGVEADVDFGEIELRLSARHARALDGYDDAEPIRTDGGVVMATLERGFGETRLGAETRFETGKRSRFDIGYELRDRRFAASLAEDPYYGGREDRRHTLGADFRVDVGRRLELVLGAAHQFQTTFRPGRGDTGDEADYHRTRASLRLEYR